MVAASDLRFLLGTIIVGILLLVPGARTSQAEVRVEFPGGAPRLQVLRNASILVRIVNDAPVPLPGGDAQDFARGASVVFVGHWFADDEPKQLGTFEGMKYVGRTLAPGEAVEVTLNIRPNRPGRQYLGAGLFRASQAQHDNGPVGRIATAPVEVAGGSALDNYRPAFLTGLVGAHILGFAVVAAWLARAAFRSW